MPLNPLSRGRAPRPNPADDPTLAQDLLGVPASATTSGGVETIDSTDPVSASDHELGKLLADRAPRPHLPWGTTVLAAAVLLAIGYVAGGYHYHNKTSGSSAASAFAGARTGARAGAGGFGGFGGAGAGGTGSGAPGGTGTGTTGGAGGTGGIGGLGGATIGTVKLVDGNNVYLTTTSGATVKVTLAPTATVTVTAKGKLSDLAPGTSVVVVGATAADGTVTATAVTQGGGFGGARAGG